MTTLDELVTPMTVEEAKTSIYDALVAQGVVTTSWKPGAVVRTIVAALAVALAGLSWVQSQLARMGFLDYAEEDWLTMTARYVYGVERLSATFATGTVVFDNAGGGVYSGGAGDLVVSSSTTGKEYRSTGAWSIGALATGVEIDVIAVESGTDSNASAEEIDTLVTALLGVTCENPSALIGTDEEGDAALRQRCRDSLGAVSPNGPRDAYRYVARTATRADGTLIGVTRVRTFADGYGNVDVYLATATGGVTGDAEDPDTDLGAVALAIETQCVPLAVTANVQSASATTIAVTYELWVRESIGMTEEEIEELVEAGLEEFVSTTPIGGEIIPPDSGRVYVDAIRGAIAAALPDNAVIRLTVTLPAADVDLDIDEAPVLGTVTATAVHIIEGAVE